jgi:hypothetical protein
MRCHKDFGQVAAAQADTRRVHLFEGRSGRSIEASSKLAH